MDLTLDMTLRLLAASLLGGLIGLEREIHGRAAGFRTHLLVSLGACLFVVCSLQFHAMFGNFGGSLPVGVDPGRVAAQVVTGIGFLGAGAIIREGASVRGLTTAACLWVAAGVGMIAGLGVYGIAVIVTGIALISLMLLKRVESTFYRDTYSVISIDTVDGVNRLQEMQALMKEAGADILAVGVAKDQEKREMRLDFEIKLRKNCNAASLLDTLSESPVVKKIKMSRVPQRHPV